MPGQIRPIAQMRQHLKRGLIERPAVAEGRAFLAIIDKVEQAHALGAAGIRPVGGGFELVGRRPAEKAGIVGALRLGSAPRRVAHFLVKGHVGRGRSHRREVGLLDGEVARRDIRHVESGVRPGSQIDPQPVKGRGVAWNPRAEPAALSAARSLVEHFAHASDEFGHDRAALRGGRFLQAEETRNPHEIHLEAVDVIIEALLGNQGKDALAHLRHRPIQGAVAPEGEVRPNAPLRMLDIEAGDGVDALHVARHIDIFHMMGIVEPHRDEGRLPGLAAPVDEHLQHVAALDDESMDRGHLKGIVPRVALEVLLPPAHVLGHRVDLALVPRHAAVGHGEKMGVYLARDLVDRSLKDLRGPRLAPLVVGACAGDIVGRVVVEEHPIGRSARRR